MADAQEQCRNLATVSTVLGLWQASQDGALTEEKFISLAAQRLSIARIVITSIVEAAIARQRPLEPIVGRGADSFTDRDESSLATVIEDSDDAEMRIERFVSATLEEYTRDEIIDIAADYGATSWIWRTDGDSCDYCQAREGTEFGLDVLFKDHPNCNCYPEPVFDAGFSHLVEDERELVDA